MIEARDADQAACPFIARCVPVRRCGLADTVRVDSMVPPAPHHRRHGRIKRADRILRSEGGRSTWTSPRCIRPRQHSPHPRCFARINLATTAEDAIAMQFKPRKRRGSPSLRTCIASLRRLPDQGHDARYRAAANVLQRQVDPASLGIHFHSVWLQHGRIAHLKGPDDHHGAGLSSPFPIPSRRMHGSTAGRGPQRPGLRLPMRGPGPRNSQDPRAAASHSPRRLSTPTVHHQPAASRADNGSAGADAEPGCEKPADRPSPARLSSAR